MTQQSFPFNAVGGQPAYSADDFRAYFHAIIPENGVILSPPPEGFEGEWDPLRVETVSDDAIRIRPGCAAVNGAVYLQRKSGQGEWEFIDVKIPPLGGYAAAHDYIVLRFDLDARNIAHKLLRVTDEDGWADGEPQRNDTVWDIVLAIVETRGAAITENWDMRAVQQNWAAVLWKDGIFPLPVSMGGTGAKTAEQARQNLRLAAENHTHDAGDVVSGVLPFERGGLGAALTRQGVLVKSGSEFSTAPPPSYDAIFGKIGGVLGFFAPPQFTAAQLIAAWPKATPAQEYMAADGSYYNLWNVPNFPDGMFYLSSANAMYPRNSLSAGAGILTKMTVQGAARYEFVETNTGNRWVGHNYPNWRQAV